MCICEVIVGGMLLLYGSVAVVVSGLGVALLRWHRSLRTRWSSWVSSPLTSWRQAVSASGYWSRSS